MMSNVAITPEHLTEFERVFQLFDANADGFLSRQEIKEALLGVRTGNFVA